MIILQQTRGSLSSGDQCSLDLPFAETKSLTARVGPTPVFTRASTATFIGSNGLIQTAAINAARFDHNPTTLASRGLLIEESRTNLVFPSATLTTQTRTVTAVAHTLSFYGTGTVVLSGTHVATVTGTGAYPTRTTLTFTPTAGSLILTVTGSVTEAQLEAGSLATSYIPTTTASVVRSADVCSITGAAFTGMAKTGEGSVVVHGDSWQGTTPAFCQFSNDSGGSRSFSFQRNASTGALEHSDSGAGITTISASPSFPVKFGVARNQAEGLRVFYNGVGGGVSAYTTNGVQTRMLIGNSSIVLPLNGCIRSIKHFKKRLSDVKMRALTAP